MFQYMPYILISILCYALTYIMIAFLNPDVKRRMMCSAVPVHREDRHVVRNINQGMELFQVSGKTAGEFSIVPVDHGDVQTLRSKRGRGVIRRLLSWGIIRVLFFWGI